MDTLKIVNPFLKSNKFILIFYTITILLSYPLESIVIPKIFSKFFQQINLNINNNVIFEFIKYFIIFMGISSLSQVISSKLETIIIPEFNKYVSNILFQKIIYFYENNYADLELGKILARINSLPSIIRELTTDLFTWIIPKVISLIIINSYFFYYNFNLGIISLVFLAIIVYYNLSNYSKCIDISNKRYMVYEDKSEAIQDKLSNLYSIYSSDKIKDEINNYDEITEKFKKLQNSSMSCSNNIKNNNNTLTLIFFISMLAYIAYLYNIKDITKEDLIALYLTLNFYVPSLNTVITYLPDYTNHMGIITSVNDYIKQINIDRIIKPDINLTKGSIIIKNLSFGYSDDKKIFNNFNLEIKQNEKVAIVGKSGNGKSTLIKLIMGYYKVPNNTIFIDDQDINSYSLSSIRMKISYINQNTKLFNMTIYENIKYGNDMTTEYISTLILKYNLQNIFKNLPKGFDTNVGVNGDSLSGGQKQIIQLLRCYSKNNKIIILDEPTSALDNETRLVVLQIIKDISINSTLIIITHDENNLDLVNKIINLKDGKIIN
jgi:ABC-type bacteriocin/lantibiotic exporter with double-glycine peptidase domain